MAAPESETLAVSNTGLKSSEVKYSVVKPISTPVTRPVTVDQKTLMSKPPTSTKASTITPKMEQVNTVPKFNALPGLPFLPTRTN